MESRPDTDNMEPVLPADPASMMDGFEPLDDDGDTDLIDEDPEDAPRPATRRRAARRLRAAAPRPTAARPAAPQPAPQSVSTEVVLPEAESPPPEEDSEQEATKRDFDSWAQSYDWDAPQMKSKLKRLAPANYHGVKLIGFLDEKHNAAFSEAEIAGRYGGGSFEMSVIGYDKKGKYRQLAHKQIHIAGDPRTDREALPPSYEDDGDFYLDEGPPPPPTYQPAGGRTAPRGVRRPGYAAPTAVAEDGTRQQALEMLNEQFNWMRNGMGRKPGEETQSLKQAELIRSSLENAATLHVEGAQAMMKEKDSIVAEQRRVAEREIDMAQQRVVEAQKEKDKAIAEANTRAENFRTEREQTREELRKIEGRMHEERDQIQKDMTSRLDEVRASGNQLLTLLLPQQQLQAQAQIDMTMKMYEARLSNMETRHTSQLTSLEKSYEVRVQTQQDLFRMQHDAAKSMYESRVRQLEHDLTTARDEVRTLTSKLDDVRKELVLEVQKATKAGSPAEQLTQLGGLVEMITGIQDTIGGGKKGGDGDDLTDGIDNPIAKTGARLLDKFIGVVPNITEAISAMRANAAAGPPAGAQTYAGQQQQMQQMPQQQMPQMQPQQQRVVRRLPPGAAQSGAGMLPPVGPGAAPTPVAKRKTTPISKEDLVIAIRFINGALEQVTPPPPDDFARAAMTAVSNATLRELARRPPDRVIAELEQAGILTGRAASADGRVFVTEVLKALKTKVL